MPTIKELHNKIRQYNASNCIKGYSNKKKATLVQIVSKLKTPTQHKQAGAGAGAGAGKKKKKIKPTLVSAGVGGGSSMSFGMPAGGGTEAQKSLKRN